MPTKKQLISHIWEYKKRRDVLIKKYGYRTGKTRVITDKIRTWQRQIRIIDKRNKKISLLIKSINDYFDVDITERYGDSKKILARRVYFKYGMEHGIMGKFLSESIGFPSRAACRSRKQYSKTFKTNPSNKEAYHKFKDYITKT